MSKILIATNHSYMFWRFRRELIQRLMKEHEVVLSMPFVGHREDFQALGLKCINTPIERRGVNPATDLRLVNEYRRLIKEEAPDLVITYSIKPNIYAGLVCRLMGIPYYTNVQGLGTAFQRPGLAQFVTLLYRTALKKAETVFFENDENAREFLDRKIIAPEKVTVLSGAGVNLTDYPLTPYPRNDRIHFLYLGRIMKEKGMDELIQAVRKLHCTLNGQVTLDLVGFFDDDYKEQVERLVADGIAVFHGFQTEPRPYYAAADCVVLPSYHEGMSNVLLEAAAMGRPVITSDIHGCKEAVDREESGFLCSVKDAESLYEQMLRMAHLSVEEREGMGKAARRKMEREFDREEVVTETVNALFRADRQEET